MTSSRGNGVPPRARRVSIALFSAGILAVVVGLVLALTSPGQATYGWFAYTPLSDVSFSPDVILLSPQATAGVAIGITGLLLVAFCAGLLLGARRRS